MIDLIINSLGSSIIPYGKISDFITTSLESFAISYIVNYFCNNKKIDKKRLWLGFIIITILKSNFFQCKLNIFWIQTLVCVFLIFIVISILYRKQKIRAITASSSIMLSILAILMLTQEEIYTSIKTSLNMNVKFITIWYVTLFIRWINVCLQLKYKDLLCGFFDNIIDEGKYLVIFLVSLDLFTVFAICSFDSIYEINNDIIDNLVLIVFLVFLILILVYIVKLSEKNNRVHKLNLELQSNNNNLRRIKHDYGAQISYLYGLCLMNRFDDLKKSLKDIINKSQFASVIGENEVNSMIYLAIKQAVYNKNINISIEGTAKLYLIDMSEMDLFRVIFNIAHNAVEAMNEEGNITAKLYERSNKIIIKIQNDGPEIPEEVRKKIFSTGFTTKDNRERCHGFGLSIVKELVEKSKGKISVESTEALTEFKMVFEVEKEKLSK